ncbi:hypothetical protein RI129_012068 [Pyrocoelia pectoralis]|uniref:Uncharacterized protein n=1 Tax=Pyrocoelia pectoralis TaxID=417401 RepID=A0AAN7ZGG1_9COLE
MAWKSSEEFWNTTSSTSFNFDDDFEPSSSSNYIGDLKANYNSSSIVNYNFEGTGAQTLLPIESLLTKRNLDAVLDDVRITYQTPTPSAQETIIKMFLGMPYSLSVYRSLSQKLELLDEAIASDDGNIILAVLLFLKKTLELPELYNHLSKRKVAFRHYCNYLMEALLVQELSNLLLCGLNVMVYVYYTGLEKEMSKDKVHLKLLRYFLDYTAMMSNEKRTMFTDYKNFTAWQIENKVSSDTITEELAALCKSQWENSSDGNSCGKQITEFRALHNLNDFQYEWVIINALCAFKMWKRLKYLFIKPNWLTKRNIIKSVINPQLFITVLHKHNAPISVLEEFLSCIVDTDVSLFLAKKLLCHAFVINFYASQRDRMAIHMYKSEIPRESEYYNYAERILVSDKRWKN